MALMIWGWLVITGAGVGIGFSQSSQSVNFQADVPQRVTQASISVVGTPGNNTYYYWIVARYPVGTTFPGGPFPVFNAPNTLGVSNYVRVNWNTISGVTNYDVLRTTTPSIPSSGVCANCLVAGTVVGGVFDDQGGANTLSTTMEWGSCHNCLALVIPSVSIPIEINP